MTETKTNPIILPHAELAENSTEWRNKAFSRLFMLVGVFLFLGGVVVLVACQAFLRDGVLRSVLTNVASALILAGTIIVAYEYYMRKEFLAHIQEAVRQALDTSDLTKRVTELDKLISLTNDLRPFGLQKVYRSRMEIDVRQLIASATAGREIKMLGTALMCLNPWEMQQVIIDKLKEGCTIKLLSLNPKSDFVKQRAREELRDVDEIQHVLQNTCEISESFISTLPNDLRSKITLLHYDAPPTCFLVSNGDTMIASIYLREQRGENFPHFQVELKEGGIFRPFMDHFDSLWKEVESNSRQSSCSIATGQTPGTKATDSLTGNAQG